MGKGFCYCPGVQGVTALDDAQEQKSRSDLSQDHAAVRLGTRDGLISLTAPTGFLLDSVATGDTAVALAAELGQPRPSKRAEAISATRVHQLPSHHQ